MNLIFQPPISERLRKALVEWSVSHDGVVKISVKAAATLVDFAAATS